MSNSDEYIPALSYGWLTPLYDPLLRWAMREDTFKRALIAQAQIKPDDRVLDLGCGTATLTILVKQLHPHAVVVGLDGDEAVLAIGQAKAQQAGVEVTLDHGMAFQLPYPDAAYDRVLSSLVLHHLTRENKRRTLREVRRVLRPGGELHIADFGPPHTAWARAVTLVIGRLEQAADHMAGRLPQYLHEAGFEAGGETAWYTTLLGPLSLYRAVRPH